MPPELASFVLDIAMPALGFLATGLLGLLTFTCQRILKKFDEICVVADKLREESAKHEARISVLENNDIHRDKMCALRHKEV